MQDMLNFVFPVTAPADHDAIVAIIIILEQLTFSGTCWWRLISAVLPLMYSLKEGFELVREYLR